MIQCIYSTVVYSYWEWPESMTDSILEFYNGMSTVFWMEMMFHCVPESIRIQIADTLLTLAGMLSGTGVSDCFIKLYQIKPQSHRHLSLRALQLSYVPCEWHTCTMSCAMCVRFCVSYMCSTAISNALFIKQCQIWTVFWTLNNSTWYLVSKLMLIVADIIIALLLK